MRIKTLCLISGLALIAANAIANELQIPVYSTSNPDKSIGTVTFQDTDYGLLITPKLKGLPSGIKGFHIHQNNNCGAQGKNAGGHYDPDKTNTHQGPYGKGHLGDLPALCVNDKGEATLPTLAPRLTTKDLKARALIVHENGDTYSDVPPLGGGGSRIACGVFPAK